MGFATATECASKDLYVMKRIRPNIVWITGKTGFIHEQKNVFKKSTTKQQTKHFDLIKPPDGVAVLK